MSTTNVLAMVMAGGRGERLHPLTAERSKPAVPFGGRYRVVDFALSNLIEPGTMIGFGGSSDSHRYHVTPSGITVVRKGRRGGLERVFE